MAATAVSMLPWPEMMMTGHLRVLLLDDVEEIEAVELRAHQPDVEDDERGTALRHLGQCRIGIMRKPGLVAFVLQDAGDQLRGCRPRRR